MDTVSPDTFGSRSGTALHTEAAPAAVPVFTDALGHLPLDQLPLGGIPLRHIERVAIQQTLRRAGGNKVTAARELGIAVSTLYEKLKRHATE